MTTPQISTIAPVTYQNIGQVTGFLIIPRGSPQVNIYNGDVANILLVSPNSTPSLTNSIPIQPLTNASFSGSQGAWYASALSGNVVQVTVSNAELSPSPAQIAQQINALGLATLAEQINQNTSIPSNIQTMGAPPYILNVASHAESLLTAIGSPYTLFTATANSRLWYASLSLSVCTDTGYGGGLNDMYARMFNSVTSTIYQNVNVSVGAPSVVGIDRSDVAIGGIPILSGASVIVDVNNAVNVTDAFIRAAALILVSTP